MEILLLEFSSSDMFMVREIKNDINRTGQHVPLKVHNASNPYKYGATPILLEHHPKGKCNPISYQKYIC